MDVRGRLFRRVVWSAACAAAASASALGAPAAHAQVRYDVEYPSIAYTTAPTDNPIAQLQERLKDGEVDLEYRPERGYFDSILEALGVSPSSQVLVYSKTSIQQEVIDAAAPRAVFFNDDAYVGFVQGTNIVEFAAMDAAIGPVFYVLQNQPELPARIERQDERCLSCHDTYGMMGGGVPLLVVRSSLVDVDGERLTDEFSSMTTDATPFEERWGGWYVTGRHGDQVHRGNIQAHDAAEIADLDAVRRGNLDTLDGADLFDTEPYPTATSDIVALMVLEHQVTVQNQITYVMFKAPSVLERMGLSEAADAQTWDELPAQAQRVLTRMLDELADRLLLVDAIALDEPVTGTAGFDAWFEEQGPRDDLGRSLRELDLETRLFRRPLSYLIYSDAFDGLPGFAKDYVYRRIARVLDGAETSEAFAHVSAEDRQELREILTATKPEFARFADVEADG